MPARVYHASAIERWAYFLQNVQSLTREEVAQIFPDREFVEAAGVLEMISRTPEQQMQYEARLKFQMDEAARLEYADEKGFERGIEQGIEKGIALGISRGELLGRIAMLQELLGVSDPGPGELSTFDEAKLAELADQLKHQLRNRGDFGPASST